MEYVRPQTSFKCDGCGRHTHWLVSLRFRGQGYEGGTSELCASCSKEWGQKRGIWLLLMSELNRRSG